MADIGVNPALADRVLASVNACREEITAAISDAVRIQSVNPRYPGQIYDDVVGSEGEMSRLVAEIYRRAGAEVDLFSLEPGRDNAVGVRRGRGAGRSLIYNGHVDVVPPGNPDNWRSGEPFSGRFDGERIWGRGSTDMKSGLLAQAFAAVALERCGVELWGDLILEAVVGEECMNNDVGVSATVERGYTADAAVVAEPSTGARPLTVMPASPGQLWFSLQVAAR
jgi:acetylornithine deacetylase/succinyl-diaminopimelate desuccinylase-like protein